jgi:hypothetical protein
MVPAQAQRGSNTERCTSVLKSSRRSQSLRDISGARWCRSREEGVQKSKSRKLWHCGVFRHKVFGRARFPGCADVVLLWRWSHGL